ncbi:hypothetical protein HK104_007865 [Borealophlyctis nickersoniae]|nr:hypothetical protein HK104_007865 [Borealophlyctis nickersoniae]
MLEALSTAPEDDCVANYLSSIIGAFAQRDGTAENLPLDLFLGLVLQTPLTAGKWISCAARSFTLAIKRQSRSDEMIGTVHQSQILEKLVDRARASGVANDPKFAALFLRVAAVILKEWGSMSAALMNDFKKAGGYTLCSDLAFLAVCDKDVSNQVSELVSITEDLLLTGPPTASWSARDATKWQHVDFTLPLPKEGATVINLEALDIHTSLYLKRCSDARFVERLDDAKLEDAQQTFLLSLAEILRANPVNYFIIEPAETLLTLIENLPRVDIAVQRVVMQILTYVVSNLNYVPHEELSALFVYFQDLSSQNTIMLVCHTCQTLFSQSRKIKDAFREVGLLDAFARLLVSPTVAGPASPDLKIENGATCGWQNCFSEICAVLSSLLEEPHNVGLFRQIHAGALFSVLDRDEARPGLLLIIDRMLRDCTEESDAPELARLIEILQSSHRLAYGLKVDILKTIGHALSSTSLLRITFREHGGFVAVFSTLVTLEGAFHNQVGENVSSTDSTSAVALLRALVQVMISAVANDCANRQVLAQHFTNGAIEDGLRLSGIFSSSDAHVAYDGMLSIALEDPTLVDVRTYVANDPEAQTGKMPIVQQLAIPISVVYNVDAVVSILRVLPDASEKQQNLVVEVLRCIHALAAGNKRNLVEMNRAGVNLILFNWLFGNHAIWFMDDESRGNSERAQQQCQEIIYAIAQRLIAVDLPDPQLRALFSYVDSEGDATDRKQLRLMDLILHGLERGRSPPHFYFERKIGGTESSCILVKDFGKPFPPMGGYSLSMWLCVEQYDENSLTDILRITDEEENTRLLVSFENGASRKLRVQTIKSTVTFSTPTFSPGVWYHLVLVHQKPKITPSYISLYVNGVLVDSLRLGYLGHPGTASKVKTIVGLSSESGDRTNGSCAISLGPTYFVEEALLDAKAVAIMFNLGCDYSSHFQGLLEKYNTHEPWYAFQLSDRKKQENSVTTDPLKTLVSQTKTGVLGLPEDKILIALCALNDVAFRRKQQQLETSNLNAHPKAGTVLNSAQPEASMVVSGDVLVCCPQRVDTGIWKLGGCGILLELVERSNSPDALYKSLTVLVESIRHNWRYTAEMEANGYYEVLGYLLKSKKQHCTMMVIDTLFALVGRTLEHFDKAVIANSTAFRQILLDPELWRTSQEVQKYFLTQFADFVFHSANHEANIKVLTNMAIFKRFMLFLELRILSDELLPDFVNLMRVFFKSNFTSGTARTFCTFLMTTVRGEPQDQKGHERLTIESTCGQSTIVLDAATVETGLSHNVMVRNILLEMLLSVLCDTSPNLDYANQFGKFVTPRWILLFFSPNLHPYTVALASRIFARLWQHQDPSYSAAFRDGFTVLADCLPMYCNVTQLYPPLLAVLSGLDVVNLPWDLKVDVPTLLAVFKPGETKGKRVICPDVTKVLYAMLKRLVTENEKLRAPGPQVTTEGLTHSAANLADLTGTLVKVLCEMFVHAEDLKDALGRPDAVEDLMELIFLLIWAEPPSSPENELILKDGGDSSRSVVPSDGEQDAWVTEFPETEKGTAATTAGATDVSPSNEATASVVELIVAQATPPSTLQSQNAFQCFILARVMTALQDSFKKRTSLGSDARVLANMAKFVTIIVDKLYQRAFPESDSTVYDFATAVLEAAQPAEKESLNKAARIDASVNVLHRQLNRITLFHLSEMEFNTRTEDSAAIFLQKLVYNQRVWMHPNNTDTEFFRAVSYRLWLFIAGDQAAFKSLALNVWKLMLLQKPAQVATILRSQKGVEHKELIDGFGKLLEMDMRGFLTWLDIKKDDLAISFKENAAPAWQTFMANETRLSRETGKAAHLRRAAKLKRKMKRAVADQETLNHYATKTQQWLMDVHVGEQRRLDRYNMDYAVTENFIATDWATIRNELTREKLLWGLGWEPRVRWKLDFTEGRSRMRKKLRPNRDIHTAYLPKAVKASLDTVPLRRTTSGAQDTGFLISEEERTETASEVSPTEFDSNDWEEVKVDTEEKTRRIMRLLDAGDAILEMHNIARVMGLDVCEGLLLFCKNNVYLVDNYFLRSDGELIDVDDIPEQERNAYYHMLDNHPNIGTTRSSEKRYNCRKWSHQDIKEVHKRLFLFRNVALEIFLSDGRNFLLATGDSKARDTIYHRLLSKAALDASEPVSGIGAATASEPHKMLQQTIFGGGSISDLTQRWCQREISNFSYLMQLNTLAGRSYNDLTQYPVFPWVLADWISEQLDLENPAVYRDFSKPMGVQGAQRAEQFIDRYNNWEDSTIPGCHYGVHYSSSMIVCSYLIRLEPFTRQYLKLQGGHFDHPDRLFHSMGSAWKSASQESTTDIRELIPEFFYLPEFLSNHNRFSFGTKQTGEVVDDVILPAWAKGDPHLFIQKHREALESDYVSAHLHEWIDLIFGYKQRGEEAVKAVNVFHYLSYEGAVNIDKIEDAVERQATVGIIHNFGQTPCQLFKKAHPKRNVDQAQSDAAVKLWKSPDLLVQSAMPLRVLPKQPISAIQMVNGKVFAVGPFKAMTQPSCKKVLDWDYLDDSIRLRHMESGKTVAVFENLHVGRINCAVFVNRDNVITGGSDAVICVWTYIHGKKSDFILESTLRGHQDTVLALAVSKSFSIIVSGASDNTAIVWDLHRRAFVRSLAGHDGPVVAVSINDNTGDIGTATTTSVRIWTINGDLLISKCISMSLSDNILCCLLYEGKPSEINHTTLVFTGHRKGVVKIWQKTFVGLPPATTGRALD